MKEIYNEKYNDPNKYISLGENTFPYPVPDFIMALGLSQMVFVTDGEGQYYLDVEFSQQFSKSQIEREQYLNSLSPEEREKELENDFVGGGCH